MDIIVRMSMGEQESLELLRAMCRMNARILRESPTLPLLYDSGVVYRLEAVETWSDVTYMLITGHEDCDSLATYRAGEILARGWRAIRPGDPGWEEANELRPDFIEAEPILRTRSPAGVPGLYHVLTQYEIGGKLFVDDPSARLGMRRHLIDPIVLDRWRAAGVRARATPLGIE